MKRYKTLIILFSPKGLVEYTIINTVIKILDYN